MKKVKKSKEKKPSKAISSKKSTKKLPVEE